MSHGSSLAPASTRSPVPVEFPLTRNGFLRHPGLSSEHLPAWLLWIPWASPLSVVDHPPHGQAFFHYALHSYSLLLAPEYSHQYDKAPCWSVTEQESRVPSLESLCVRCVLFAREVSKFEDHWRMILETSTALCSKSSFLSNRSVLVP